MSAIEQDLDEYMMGDEPDWDAPPEAPQDADRADEQLRRLAKVRAEMAQIGDHARAQIERINEWHARRVEVLAGRERWLAEGLEMWHRAVLADDPSRKTISLPCGTLKSRVQPPVWEFDDEVFIAWAADNHDELLRRPEPKVSVDKAAAKKALIVPEPGDWLTAAPVTADGEIPPGVSVTVRPPSFTVTTEEVGR